MNQLIWDQFLDRVTKIQQFLSSSDKVLESLFQRVKIDWKNILKSPYVSLVGSIIGQKISFKQARNIRGNLYSKLGTNFTINQMMSVSNPELESLGMNSRMISILQETNKYLIESKNDLSSIDLIRQLTQVSGIGIWTVETILLSSGMDWDAFPSNDLFIAKKLKQLYNLPQKPTPKEMETLFSRWKPYRGIVCWYLWRDFN